MRRTRAVLYAFLSVTFALLWASPSRAASLTQVNNWQGGISLPTDVSMFVYVPDNVTANPPLLTLIHYCGGNASSVFGQASGLVQAADQYKYIIVVPSNGGLNGTGRCWDITSKATQTRDGGGDSQAVIQMVRYALTTYKANANRVYSTGDSSGAMMTQLLLALYPDVFKAGASFAGVPAGCLNAFDSQGLCGLAMNGMAPTAAQWGNLVRGMDPGYSGYRPRVQLFQGSADATINFENFNEGIKEWTNVLDLSTAPTTTTTGLTLGTHQATRQSWKSSCGYVVLDAFTSIGGDHGPSDALFVAQYVVPFLGLDQTGAVDPEVAQCEMDGGGGGSDGGVDASSGRGDSGSAGASGGSGTSVSGATGSSGMGGTSGSSGTSGAITGSSGTSASGATGGSAGSTGASGSGGSGSAASGNSGTQSSGAASSGASGGNNATPDGGSGSSSGSAGPPPSENSSANGCGCVVSGGNSEMNVSLGLMGLGLVAAGARIGRRRRSAVGPDGNRHSAK